jgi:hypothetical protein
MNRRKQGCSQPPELPAKAHLPRRILTNLAARSIVDFDGITVEYDGWRDKDVLDLPREDVSEAPHELHAEG